MQASMASASSVPWQTLLPWSSRSGVAPAATPPSRPKELEMTRCGSFLCPTNGRRPVGVLISAYSLVENTYQTLLTEAHVAGRTSKRASPAIPTALITHKPELAEGNAFDFVVPVRPDLLVKGAPRGMGYQPQWFTRLYYYASSPFTITIAIDSNAAVCGPVEPLAAAMRLWDFAVPSQLRDCEDAWPHNFMMAYSWSRRTEVLFERWVLAQVQAGVPIDDQQTLETAIGSPQTRDARVKIGRIMGGAALSLNTLDTKTFRSFLPSVTPLLRGSVSIVHPFNMPGADQCSNWNVEPKRSLLRLFTGSKSRKPHVFVALKHGSGVQLIPAYHAGECNSIANQTCAPPCGKRYAYHSNNSILRYPYEYNYRALAPKKPTLVAPFFSSLRLAPKPRRAGSQAAKG